MIGLLPHFGENYGICIISLNNTLHFIDGGNFFILETIHKKKYHSDYS